MTSRLSHALAPAAAAVVAVVLGCGNSSGTECSCGDPSATVDLPPDRAAQVIEVELAGTACSGATATCTQPVASGCAQYTFRATGAGKCDVDVLFATGPADFHAELSFAAVTCCSGFYARPPEAGHVEVPGAAGDAGAAG